MSFVGAGVNGDDRPLHLLLCYPRGGGLKTAVLALYKIMPDPSSTIPTQEAGIQSMALLWLRYTGFIVLYPLGKDLNVLDWPGVEEDHN